MKPTLFVSFLLAFPFLTLSSGCTERTVVAVDASAHEPTLLADDDDPTAPGLPGDPFDPDDVDEDFLADAPPAAKLDEPTLVQLLTATGFPKKAIPKLVCTAKFESHLDPSATNLNRNGTHDTGLFQINDIWLAPCGLTRHALLDPAENAKCALRVWKKQGLTAWSAFKRKRRTCLHYRVALAQGSQGAVSTL